MKQEKVLTRGIVLELGLDKLEVITSDMLEGYTSIGYDAFEKCFAVTSITIPNSVTSIGEYAFAWCSALTSITIPNSITSIESMVFAWCSALTSITIPNSVTSIGSDAFYGCSSLTSITIPNSVTSIGLDAFYNVPNVVYNGTATGSPWGARSVNGYVDGYLVYADDTKTTLLACSAAATGEVSIPNSVTIIEGGAFYQCSSLTSITIPNSITHIGDLAFYSCSLITSIIIPNSIINIRQNAFYGCCKLSNIIIGDKTYETQKVVNGKCKAYKAFNADMTCREFQYKEGNTYEIENEPILCRRGFHACLNLKDVFNYYFGKIGKDIVVHEVELESVFEERRDDSKVVAKKITIGKRIL